MVRAASSLASSNRDFFFIRQKVNFRFLYGLKTKCITCRSQAQKYFLITLLMIHNFDYESQLHLKAAESSFVSQHTAYIKEVILIVLYSCSLPQHPELKDLVSDFLAHCFLTKPGNVYASASTFFSSYVANDVPQFIPTIITGPSGVGKGTCMISYYLLACLLNGIS